jgi:hypothetical protein
MLMAARTSIDELNVCFNEGLCSNRCQQFVDKDSDRRDGQAHDRRIPYISSTFVFTVEVPHA